MWAMHLCVARSSKTRTLKISCTQEEKTLKTDPRTAALTHIIPGYDVCSGLNSECVHHPATIIGVNSLPVFLTTSNQEQRGTASDLKLDKNHLFQRDITSRVS